MRRESNGEYQIGNRVVSRRKFNVATAGIIFLVHAILACLMFMKSGESPVYSWFGWIFTALSLPYLNAFMTKRFVLYEAIYLFFAGILLNYTAILLIPEEGVGLH